MGEWTVCCYRDQVSGVQQGVILCLGAVSAGLSSGLAQSDVSGYQNYPAIFTRKLTECY